jgi:Nif-specific regulatory protein
MSRDPSQDRLSELEDENQRLRRSLEELSLLRDIAAAISTNTSLSGVIEFIVQKSMQSLQVEQGVIFFFEARDSHHPLKTLWREAGSRTSGVPYRLGDQLLGWMLKNQKPLVINDATQDPRFRVLTEADVSVRSLLGAPLRFKGEFLGVLTVFNKKIPGGFSEHDERLLCIIAAQSAPVLRTAQLIGELQHDRERLAEENTQLWREVRTRFSTDKVIGGCEPLRKVLALVERIRDATVDVLITGESGTGKELMAKTVHYSSPRARKPFVALNCAALPENLLESELFGIEKGVATGVEKRIGQFEAAHGGTLFLDEIGDLSLTAQAKILRVLQERVVQRLGGRETIPIDVRVLAATNQDLEEAIKQGKFREDLYYRLKVIHLRLPPLRTIPDDIEQLAHYFLAEMCREMKREPLRFSAQAMHALRSAPWPGNIRQLQNEIKRLAICALGPVIEIEDLAPEIGGEALSAPPPAVDSERVLDDAVGDYEKRFLMEALRNHGNNQVQTAKALGLSRQGLIKKMKRFGIAGPSKDSGE